MTAPAQKVSPLSILVGHIFLWLIFVAIAAGAGAGLAAGVAGVAPLFTANLVGPLFCPAGATPSLYTLYGQQYRDSDGNNRQQQTQQINCADAQGVIVESSGERFPAVWYGGWIAACIAVATVLYVLWIVVSNVRRVMSARQAISRVVT